MLMLIRTGVLLMLIGVVVGEMGMAAVGIMSFFEKNLFFSDKCGGAVFRGEF